jgi:hypothetical protein
MKTILLSALCLAALLVACGKKESPGAGQQTNGSAAGNPITAPVDYLGAVAKAQKTSVKVVDTASLTKTLQLFNAQEERWPKDLNELVTMKYLPSLPAPPHGMKFDYDPRSGAFRIVKE